MSNHKEAKAKGTSLWTIFFFYPKGIGIEVGRPPNKRPSRNLIRQRRTEINPCKRNVSALSPWIGSDLNHNTHEKTTTTTTHETVPCHCAFTLLGVNFGQSFLEIRRLIMRRGYLPLGGWKGLRFVYFQGSHGSRPLVPWPRMKGA